MAFFGLCLLCSPIDPAMFTLPGNEPVEVPVAHCYGTGDRLTPGVIGGFVCSCPCRNWTTEADRERSTLIGRAPEEER